MGKTIFNGFAEHERNANMKFMPYHKEWLIICATKIVYNVVGNQTRHKIQET